MKNKFLLRIFFAYLLLFTFISQNNFAQKIYYPTADNWEKRTPEQAKFDSAKLKEAIDFAVAGESKAPRDMELAQSQTFGREPFGEIIGATKPRGEMTGIIIRNGYIVAEWASRYASICLTA
jgi:hypothetical protein